MSVGVQLGLFGHRSPRRKADEAKLLARLREIDDIRRPILGTTMSAREIARLMRDLPPITVPK